MLYKKVLKRMGKADFTGTFTRPSYTFYVSPEKEVMIKEHGFV